MDIDSSPAAAPASSGKQAGSPSNAQIQDKELGAMRKRSLGCAMLLRTAQGTGERELPNAGTAAPALSCQEASPDTDRLAERSSEQSLSYVAQLDRHPLAHCMGTKRQHARSAGARMLGQRAADLRRHARKNPLRCVFEAAARAGIAESSSDEPCADAAACNAHATTLVPHIATEPAAALQERKLGRAAAISEESDIRPPAHAAPIDAAQPGACPPSSEGRGDGLQADISAQTVYSADALQAGPNTDAAVRTGQHMPAMPCAAASDVSAQHTESANAPAPTAPACAQCAPLAAAHLVPHCKADSQGAAVEAHIAAMAAASTHTAGACTVDMHQGQLSSPKQEALAVAGACTSPAARAGPGVTASELAAVLLDDAGHKPVAHTVSVYTARAPWSASPGQLHRAPQNKRADMFFICSFPRHLAYAHSLCTQQEKLHADESHGAQNGTAPAVWAGRPGAACAAAVKAATVPVRTKSADRSSEAALAPPSSTTAANADSAGTPARRAAASSELAGQVGEPAGSAVVDLLSDEEYELEHARHGNTDQRPWHRQRPAQAAAAQAPTGQGPLCHAGAHAGLANAAPLCASALRMSVDMCLSDSDSDTAEDADAMGAPAARTGQSRQQRCTSAPAASVHVPSLPALLEQAAGMAFESGVHPF